MADPQMLKRLKDLERRKSEIIAATTDQFAADLDKSLSRLNARIPQLFSDLKVKDGAIRTTRTNLNRAVQSRVQIEEILFASGYRESVDKLLDSYKELAALSKEGLKIGGVDAAFTASDISSLGALREMDFRRWATFGDEIVESAHRRIMDAVISGDRFGDMVEGLSTTLTGTGLETSRIPGRAKVLSNTFAQSFDRTATARKAKTANIDTFIYVGPDDEVTREFCLAVLTGEGSSEFNIPRKTTREVFSRSEIESMDNGTDLPVLQFGGGFNCRHRWRPISKELAREVTKA